MPGLHPGGDERRSRLGTRSVTRQDWSRFGFTEQQKPICDPVLDLLEQVLPTPRRMAAGF